MQNNAFNESNEFSITKTTLYNLTVFLVQGQTRLNFESLNNQETKITVILV